MAFNKKAIEILYFILEKAPEFARQNPHSISIEFNKQESNSELLLNEDGVIDININKGKVLFNLGIYRKDNEIIDLEINKMVKDKLIATGILVEDYENGGEGLNLLYEIENILNKI